MGLFWVRLSTVQKPRTNTHKKKTNLMKTFLINIFYYIHLYVCGLQCFQRIPTYFIQEHKKRINITPSMLFRFSWYDDCTVAVRLCYAKNKYFLPLIRTRLLRFRFSWKTHATFIARPSRIRNYLSQPFSNYWKYNII